MSEDVVRRAFIPVGDWPWNWKAKAALALANNPFIRHLQYEAEIATEVDRWRDDGGRDDE